MRKPALMKQRKQSTVSYVCADCGAKEDIPEDVLDYFDEVNPMQIFHGAHEFACEKCGKGIMKPEKQPEILIKGIGLFEGLGQD